MQGSIIAVLSPVCWFLLLGFLFPGGSVLQTVREWRDVEWPHGRLWSILAVALVLNFCLAPGFVVVPLQRPAAMFAAMALSLCFVRLLAARLFHEKGAGWTFYAALIWMSPFWVPFVVTVRFNTMN